MIREALYKNDVRQIPNASFSQGSIFDKNLENSSYDKVIAFGILHLLNDYEKVIQRIYEILKPGGVFISTTACFNHQMDLKTRMQVMVFLLMKKLGLSPLHLNKFMPADVEKALKDQNFQIMEAEKFVEGIPAVFLVAAK
jgi:2-polyprenyl-3-methyl-5-hydroxy-6-metoxy-1,4-benzoquinol methylase